MKLFLSIGLCIFCLMNPISIYAQDAGSDGLVVTTVNGNVQGYRESSGILSFKGIPFAAPPVGAFRWKEPQPVKTWKGILEAKRFGPRAMQPPIFSDMVFRSNGMSEDCLYLNVWTPDTKGKLPVLVYFYGGGFVAGDGSEGRYDGESMAKNGIVSLTVNYRLGVFGALAHPELTKESPHQVSGNYGLMDQSAALHWVKENITAFGGDPEKITIAGESAGSVSVSAQMVSPLSKHLIAGAIGESGSLLGALPPIPLVDAEKNGVAFQQFAAAGSLAALRNLSADSLLSISVRYGAFRFPYSIDGYFFPKDPLAIFKAGEQAHVPLMVGWNSEEMNYRMLMGNEPLTRENYAKAVRKIYGQTAEQVLEVYSAATDADVEQAATDLAGDRFIGFSTWRWATLQGATGTKPVYRYYYQRPRPELVLEKGATQPPRAKGAVHSAEIEYCMGNLHYNKVFAWTEEDQKVSRTLQGYFVNFIKYGDPNGKGLPHWPVLSGKQPASVMYIDVESKAGPEKYPARYPLLEQLTSGH